MKKTWRGDRGPPKKVQSGGNRRKIEVTRVRSAVEHDTNLRAEEEVHLIEGGIRGGGEEEVIDGICLK
jgi:hypothetical protein